jgi:hypothetical protein
MAAAESPSVAEIMGYLTRKKLATDQRHFIDPSSAYERDSPQASTCRRNAIKTEVVLTGVPL